jgi:hypothetical protein
MTDADLVAKKLTSIETCVRELARPELIGGDPREERSQFRCQEGDP